MSTPDADQHFRRMDQAYGSLYRDLDVAHRSRASARRVLPLVFDLHRPASIVDVGCGVGSWLAVAMELGIDDVLGLDADYVDRNLLVVPADRFLAVDLRDDWTPGRTFDLALCLETVGYLDEADALRTVARLTELAPVVLFSAAIPHQDDTGMQVTQRWQAWWAEHFAAHGYVPVDVIRRAVWDETDIAIHQAQNTILYVSERALDDLPALAKARDHVGDTVLSVVHPRAWEIARRETESRTWRDDARGLVRRSIPRSALMWLRGARARRHAR
jgi:SAM-dependent methyltransferase